MGYDFVDISGPLNRDNAGGLAAEVLYAPVSHFTSIEVPGAYSAAGDEVKITTDHTFDAGKGFVKLKFVVDSHALSASMPEERDASGYRASLEGDVVAETEEEIAEVLRNLLTDDLIVLVKTANGKYIQMGTEDFPAAIRQSEDTTGSSVEGVNKQRVVAMANQPKKLFYSGTVTLKP
jgi:hypothetical protein